MGVSEMSSVFAEFVNGDAGLFVSGLEKFCVVNAGW